MQDLSAALCCYHPNMRALKCLMPALALGVLAIPICAQLKILTADIPNTTAGSAYTTSFAASGLTATTAWAASGSFKAYWFAVSQ